MIEILDKKERLEYLKKRHYNHELPLSTEYIELCQLLLEEENRLKKYILKVAEKERKKGYTGSATYLEIIIKDFEILEKLGND